jgi:uncharacterized membrane protein
MSARLASIDRARGAALWAMAGYHLTWDLAQFGWIDSKIVGSAGFHWIGHAIAASFLTLAGFSLVLARSAQGPLACSRRFWRRWASIVAAAAAISAVSYAMFPEAPIFFGILHCIALSILIALPFVEAPLALALLAGALALAAPLFATSSFFDAPMFWWTGLSTFEPTSNDYRPLLPWVGFALLGLALGRAKLPLPASGERERFGPLAFCGRHSLAFYLIHQPLLFGLFSILALFTVAPTVASAFIEQCVAQCVRAVADESVCEKSCACVVNKAKDKGFWTAMAPDRLNAQQKSVAHDDAIACYLDSTKK